MAHPGGRPLKFKTVEELEEKIQAYFDSCFKEEWREEQLRDADGFLMYEDTEPNKGKVLVKNYKEKIQIKPFSVTGLAVALKTTRDLLLDYSEKDEFSDTIKEAKQIIQNYAEDGMLMGKINPTAGIFNLKNNWHWKDEVHQTIKDARLSAEEEAKMRELLLPKKPVEKTEEKPKCGQLIHTGINGDGRCGNELPCALHLTEIKKDEPNQPSSAGASNQGN